MTNINEKISHPLNINHYFDKEHICFFDIETTGLNRNKNMIYLIGILYFDIHTNNWILEQYFADNLDKEIDILNHFLAKITNFDVLITYNGNSFDIPFIEHRLKYHNMDYTIKKDKSFDLYQLIRKNKAFLPLENLKLKTIEEYLGFHREDKYTGYDCIKFYYDYIKSHKKYLKDDILKHNYDDLVHMLDVISIIDVLDTRKSFNLDFDGSSIKFTFDDIQTTKELMIIEGKLDKKLSNNIKHFDKHFQLVTKDFDSFSFSIGFKRGYVSDNEIGSYIDTLNFPMLDINDSTNYSLPSNIYILMVDKKYCVDNLKNIVKAIFKKYN